MKTEKYKILTPGGIRLHALCRKPEKPVAVLFFVHGQGESGETYKEMSRYFAKHNIASFAYDMRGHGKSEGKRSSLLSVEQMIADMERCLMKARSCYTELPIFVLGHNMGAHIMAGYLMRLKSKEIRGAILSSPWIKPNIHISLWKKVCCVMLSKPFTRSKIKQDNQQIFDEPCDMHVQYNLSFSLLQSFGKSSRFLLDNSYHGQIPVLVSLGSDEKETSLNAAKKLFLNFKDSGKFKVWEALDNNYLHHKTRAKIYDYLHNWIQKNL